MKVVFLTNFITHHQIGFCEEMNSLLKGEFKVVVFKPIDAEREKLGFVDNNSIFPYIIRVYEGDESKKEALTLCVDADVVIWGSAPIEYLEERRKLNKVTFIYTERIFKNGLIRILDPRVMSSMNKKFRSQRDKKQYYMCASGYTPYDINLVTKTPEKMYKWGYFPSVCDIELNLLLDKKNNSKIEILWVGRLIDWKHPESVVFVANFLKERKIDFVINVVGTGDKEDIIKKQIVDNNLQDYVNLCGPKNPEEIGKYYEKANIFIATSDKQEGWGAVINEAMSYGCAVVASHEMGSVPFLISNNENGLVFCSENWKDLSDKVLYLVENEDERNKIAKNAYQTIQKNWNVKNATKKLVELFDAVLRNEDICFTDGPCSRAEVITEKSFLKTGNKNKTTK